ncbi:MAG: polysaccharide deacetylase family protein [Candidatus Bathyarchaeota archaeon]|nr:polysaccharide deacetylase family protein [Candidatus Bathyarchaeota archaeon]MDH5687767.1 polysaccharide deacetylase family protein [Candidatus Bathyarchaeota archaeon]
MTLYIAAYDTESPRCLAACRKIVEVHRRFDMPATFFLVGKILMANPDDYRELLDDPLFEIASHTYSHKMLRNHPFCGPAASKQQIQEEIFGGKSVVERVFGRPCLGIRPACGFTNGLRGSEDVLELIHEAGFRYVSSALWGPDFTMPAPLNQPFTYSEEGFPDLWELPGHGWHENLLKDSNRTPKRILLFPPLMPETIPSHYVKAPEEEFAFNNKPLIDRAIADGLLHVTLVWHPWSLGRFDPEMNMLELAFNYVRSRGMSIGTFSDLLSLVSI